MLGLASVAGVGFTVALFATSLSFDDPTSTEQAKLGILVGSVLAGAVGYGILRSSRAHADVSQVTIQQTADETLVPVIGGYVVAPLHGCLTKKS
jgi:hypothetical protein